MGLPSRKEKGLRRRKIDGCPIAGALQLIGDKWTLLVVRDLFAAPKRTTELLEDLHPISSRTLMGRLREVEHDRLILRVNYCGWQLPLPTAINRLFCPRCPARRPRPVAVP